MSAASSLTANRSGRPTARGRHPAALNPAWPAIIVIAAVTLLRLTGTVDSDVAWQLWIARHVHQGAHLYRDIVEINPPLWFWMALPIDRLAALTGLRAEAVLILTIGVAAMAAILATGRLLELPRGRKALLLAYAALILTALPWVHVGQREQIVLIVTLPYAALIAARHSGRPVPPGLALAIGVGAALGFALKHYFLVVPALLEMWLIAGQRRGWSAWRPEIAALAAVGLAYAGAIMLWAGDFLTAALPMIRLAYGATGAPSFADLFQPVLTLGLILLAVAAILVRLLRERDADLAKALLIAAAGFAIAYFVQRKGWPYHAIPLLGYAAIALAALMAAAETPSRFLRLAGPALLVLPLALAWQETRNPLLPDPDLSRAVAGLKPGETIGFVATEPAYAWSVTLQHGFRYPSRYMGFWMLRAVVANEARPRPDAALAEFGRRAVRETVVDFRCTPPRRIIFARPRPGEAGFDILPFFLRDPQFAALMTHYRETSRTTADVYDLQRPLPPISPLECRAGI